MCKQKDCGCGTKGGIKPTLKYCGSELPCTGIVKGDDYLTVLQKIDAVACNGGGEVVDNCSLDVEILTVSGAGATSSVVGGTPPYTYKWKYAQNTFTSGGFINDTTLPNITFGGNPCDMATTPNCVISTYTTEGIIQPSYFIPMYLTLKVKDSKGCVGQDSYMAYLTYYN